MAKKTTSSDIAYISLCSVIIAICSWINIPYIIPFTLQTFAIFFTILFLGGFKGLISILIYILIGAVGIPVFSGFKGGIGALFGITGGYIIGFIFIGLIYMIFEKKVQKNSILKVIVLIAGLAVCYAFGTAWFVRLYGNGYNAASITYALSVCVVPFIIPDIIKLALAFFLSKKISKVL